MRGDSLRDLYAKSLALLGLAALAGVGALVDYWPTDLALPRDVVRALPVPASPRGIQLPDGAALQPDRFAPRLSGPLAIVEPAAVLAHTAIVPVLAAPPDALALDVAPVRLASLSLTEVNLLLPPPLPIAVSDVEPALAQPIPLAAPVESEPVDSSPMQVLTGALRRTGQSIVQGGAKTGETIVGAFKGAFRKVPWFNLGPASRPIG